MLITCGLLLLCSTYALSALSIELKEMLGHLSWQSKLKLLDKYSDLQIQNRRVDIQAWQYPQRRQDAGLAPDNKDENAMKLKLFRLMYESVRDSDLKVKRAELIKAYYVNSSLFELGYLMGEVTGKLDTMRDIASTLKRLYEEWKPIEHINAYEQIANHAIEVNHLVDIIRTLNRKNETMFKIK